MNRVLSSLIAFALLLGVLWVSFFLFLGVLGLGVAFWLYRTLRDSVRGAMGEKTEDENVFAPGSAPQETTHVTIIEGNFTRLDEPPQQSR